MTPGPNHTHGFSRLRRRYDRHSRLDNPGFLKCDCSKRIPKVLLMVLANGCDSRNDRTANVSSIKTTAKSDFKNNELGLLFCKEKKPCSRDLFEERRRCLKNSLPA